MYVSLSEAYLNGEMYVVPVSQDLVDGVGQGEWVCLYCLREDSTITPSKRKPTPTTPVIRGDSSGDNGGLATRVSGGCYINEFGPSLSFPWQLNPTHSLEATAHASLSPSLCIMLRALALLADNSLTNILPTTRVRDSRTTDDAKDIVASEAAAQGLRLWTLQERLTILHALVLCFDACPKQAKRMEFLFAQVERLQKIAAQPVFKEGEFLRVAADLMGNDGVLQCQMMLDEAAGDHSRNRR